MGDNDVDKWLVKQIEKANDDGAQYERWFVLWNWYKKLRSKRLMQKAVDGADDNAQDGMLVWLVEQMQKAGDGGAQDAWFLPVQYSCSWWYDAKSSWWWYSSCDLKIWYKKHRCKKYTMIDIINMHESTYNYEADARSRW